MSYTKCPKCGFVIRRIEDSNKVDLTEFTEKTNLNWKSRYNLNIARIDEQHKEIVDVISELYHAVLVSDLRPNLIIDTLARLDKYVGRH